MCLDMLFFRLPRSEDGAAVTVGVMRLPRVGKVVQYDTNARDVPLNGKPRVEELIRHEAHRQPFIIIRGVRWLTCVPLAPSLLLDQRVRGALAKDKKPHKTEKVPDSAYDHGRHE